MTTPQGDLRDRFLGGMSHAACTVNIITTDGPAGRAGVTVSAMASVSADTPRPTLLVCVHHLSPAADKIIENGHFVVNVLKDDQAYISDTFAGRFKDTVEDKFDCADWVNMPSGAPRVVDPLVGFDCRIASFEKVGTHYVFIGEVHEIFSAKQGSPLVYANRAYGSTSRIDSASSIAAGRQIAENTLSISCYHTFGPYILPQIIQQMTAEDPSIRFNLVEGDHRRVLESLLAGETELALLYDQNIPDGISVSTLMQLRPYVLLAEGHPLTQKTSVTPKDLADLPMVLLDSGPGRDYFLRIMQGDGVEPLVAYKSANFEMVRGLVGRGLGYTILNTKPASSMTYDGRSIVARPLDSKTPAANIVLAKRNNTNHAKTAEKFCWHCCEFFALEH